MVLVKTQQDLRGKLAQQWLDSLNCNYQLHSPIADASFRRYWQLAIDDCIYDKVLLMDCPPEQENLSLFIETRKIFAKNLLWRVPKIFQQDNEQGFALIENFGDQLFTKAYQQDTSQVTSYIAFALNALIGLQQQGVNAQLENYDEQKLQIEIEIFAPWFVNKLCDYALSIKEQDILIQCQQRLISNMLNQSQTIIHRDYHSRNLLLILEEEHQQLGVIDFQGAFNGAITYDAVSLIKDCYWKLSEKQQYELLKNYWQNLCKKVDKTPNWQDFQRDFHYSGIQRHLKVLGIFSRLALDHDKHHYLKDIPLVLWHLTTALAQYPEFSDLHRLIKKLILRLENQQIKWVDV